MERYLILCCLLAGILSDEPVIRVTGYVGESAEIRCPYDGEFETNSKYFCRGKCSRTVFIDTKDIRVKTKKAQTTAVNGRFHLHDDTASRIFTVTITGLTAKDSGKYWCGVKTGKERMDVYTEVELTVADSPSTVPTSHDNHTLPCSPPTLNPISSAPVPGSPTELISPDTSEVTPRSSAAVLDYPTAVYYAESVIRVSGRVGGSAEIRCPYDAGYETNSKYLCRRDCSFGSKNKLVQTSHATSGRFHLHDNTSSRIFTVTITGLTAGDAEKYWCGIKTGFGVKDVYTEVELTVNATTPFPTSHESSIPSSFPPTSPAAIPTSSAPVQGNTTDPVLGRGQAEEEEEEEGGDEEGVSPVVVGVLCAVALVIIVLTGAVVSLAYYTHRRKKQEQQPDIGPASLHSSTPTEEPNDYEEHVDMGSPSGATGARASVSSIYCLAEGPRKCPSVPSLYASTDAIATTHQDTQQQQQQQQQQPMEQDNNNAPIYCNAPPPQATARRNYTLHSE
ncbi:uncharacterized protein LOC134442278 [Engraulis encrasicolus]|uniref:uncharacterized protein LOC134442278 n=1 Tax=Engraulis encrasicolus TaxID=184585 RepID=UPI002FD6A63C